MSELKLPEINRVTLSGRLTREPEKRYASDGTPVCTFTRMKAASLDSRTRDRDRRKS